MLLSEAKQKISQFTPLFDLKSLSLLGKGMASIAFLANKKWVFRFPDETLINQESLKTEITLLSHLSKALPIKIPNFQYIGKDEKNLLYVGYKILPGIQLEKATFYSLSEIKQEQTLKGLAAFLQVLHNFPVDIAKKHGASEKLYNGAYHSKQRDLLEQVSELLTMKEIAKIKHTINEFEKAKTTLSKPHALIHADLKPEHILYNSKDGNITAIIDWGDACIGDPDFDFTCLYLFYNRNFVIRLLKYFPFENHDCILDKIQFFITIRWLQDIALGMADKDDHYVSFCLAKFRHHLEYGTS